MTAIDGHEPLLSRQGAFGYDTLSTDQRRTQGTFGEAERQRRRSFDVSLFSAPSEAFARAFAEHPQYSIPASAPGGPTTKATIAVGISTYEMTSAVIHNELAPRGEQLTLTL